MELENKSNGNQQEEDSEVGQKTYRSMSMTKKKEQYKYNTRMIFLIKSL